MNNFNRSDFYDAIIAIFTGREIPMDAVMPTPEEIVEFCKNQIAILETKAATDAKRRSEKEDPLRDKIYEVVATSTEPITAAEIVLILSPDMEEISMARVSNRLTQLAKEGLISKKDATLKNDQGKTISRKVYALPNI